MPTLHVPCNSMVDKAFPGNPSNQTCSFCHFTSAAVFCNCTSPPVLLCTDCSFKHQSKSPMTPHPVMPIVALEIGAVEYMRRFEQISKAKAEMWATLARMDQCSEEFRNSIDAGIAYFGQYKDWVLQWMQSEKESARASFDAAINEAETCLARGSSPIDPMAQAMWTLPPEQLRLFTYTITPPDLHSLSQSWVTCENGIKTISERLNQIPTPAEETKTSPSPIPAAIPKKTKGVLTQPTKKEAPAKHPRQSTLSERLLYVERNQVKLFNFSRKNWDIYPLVSTAATDRGTQYVWADEDLVCCGGRH